MKQIWIYDIEQFCNLHTNTFMSKNTKEKRVFQIGFGKNDLVSYVHFLKTECAGLVGFNNEDYDYPMLHYIFENFHKLQYMTSNEINQLLYDESQRIIHTEYPAIKQPIIKQLDLFKIWHFNNKARMMSLKAIEIALNMENVQDLPFAFDQPVQENQINIILDYNLNDVEATYNFYKFSADRIALRNQLSEKFKINLRNANDTKIGESIFAKLLSQELNIPIWDLKKMRTHRTSIPLSEIILPGIIFYDEIFTNLRYKLENKIIVETKDSLSYSIPYKGIMLQYGLGGLHACCEPGVYKSNDEYIIVDVDVKSYYPNISIVNNFYPEHLGKAFCRIYKNIYEKRTTIPKSDPTNYAYKLMLNGTYGKSNDKYSFFYDPKFTMSITVNGQLLLTMLLDMVMQEIGRHTSIIQINTDGITFKIRRSDYDNLVEVCKQWEDRTNLELEYADYNQMIIRDVNNYSAQYMNGDIKHKGAFEIDKEIHKDQSMKVVRIALEKYFFEGIPVEQTIRNHDNIYDFCKRYKATKGWTPIYKYIECGEVVSETLSKNVRYYISSDGNSSLTKVHDDGRVIQVESGKSVRAFNQYIELENYQIDYSYYIAETYKLIYAVDDGQMKMF
jgi:DNA polymerase elongation subunit (family B)